METKILSRWFEGGLWVRQMEENDNFGEEAWGGESLRKEKESGKILSEKGKKKLNWLKGTWDLTLKCMIQITLMKIISMEKDFNKTVWLYIIGGRWQKYSIIIETTKIILHLFPSQSNYSFEWFHYGTSTTSHYKKNGMKWIKMTKQKKEFRETWSTLVIMRWPA